MPSLPTMPSMPKMPKKLTTVLNWPLSNVQIKNLPIFLKKENSAGTANNVQPISSSNKVNDLDLNCDQRASYHFKLLSEHCFRWLLLSRIVREIV